MRAVEKFDWRQGLPFLDLRHLVDPPGPAARRAVQGPGHTPSRGRTRRRAEGDPDQARLPRVVASLDQPLTSEATRRSATSSPPTTSPFEDGRSFTRSASSASMPPSSACLSWSSSVVRLRFGLDGSPPASLESTARALGIGVRRVRRIEASALGLPRRASPRSKAFNDAA